MAIDHLVCLGPKINCHFIGHLCGRLPQGGGNFHRLAFYEVITGTHDEFHGELVEAFVGQARAAGSGGRTWWSGVFDGVRRRSCSVSVSRFLSAMLIWSRRAWISLSAFQRGGLFLEDHVGADAAVGEIFYAFVILGAVGVGVEMQGAGRSRGRSGVSRGRRPA